jgi:hypothetical protein
MIIGMSAMTDMVRARGVVSGADGPRSRTWSSHTAPAPPNEPFEEPPFEEISGISRMRAAMETMDDDVVWVGAGMPGDRLHVGRERNEHKIVVPVWYDDDGHRIVVASCRRGEAPALVSQPLRQRPTPRSG